MSKKFDPNSQELVNAWAGAIEQACLKLDFDLKCLDWFSYTPDIYRAKINLK